MSNEEITNDELARMIKEGFDSVDKQFEQVGKKFEHVDKQFEQVGKKFEHVDKQFDKIGQRLERIEILYLTDHKKRIERLEDGVKEIKLKLAPA